MSDFDRAFHDPQWGDDFLIDRAFTGRQRELEALQGMLVDQPTKVVAILGDAGMGKTALANMFGVVNREYFAAGVYHVRTSPFESTVDTVDASVSSPAAPYLLVIDDSDHHPASKLAAELMMLRRRRPSARIIVTSRRHHSGPPFDSIIKLNGFSQQEFLDLLQKFGARGAYSTKIQLFNRLSGNVAATLFLADLLTSKQLSPGEVLTRLRGFDQSGLVDVDGNPIAADTPESRQIIADVRSVSDRLLERAHRNPGVLYDVSPYRFEEFVAELLDLLGYEVTLTPKSGDGGKDIYAAKKDHLGSFLYVVECKKYAPDHRVGVGLIRQLHGVVQAERATAGILATTSFFTKPSQEFQQRISHQMTLKDFFGIQEWLSDAFGR